MTQNDRINLKTWIENYKAGKYYNPDANVQIEAGWYDWFCSEKTLPRKTKKLAPKVIKIATLLGEDFQKNHYVLFKNNCPLNGPLYDSFSFCTMKEGDVVYWFTPKSGHSHKAEATGREVKFEKNLAEGKWSDIVSFFKQRSNK